MGYLPRLALAGLLTSGAMTPPLAAGPAFPDRFWVSLNVAAGNYSGEDNPGQMDNERSQFALQAGAGLRLRRHLGLDLEAWSIDRTYDSTVSPPPFGTASPKMTVDSAGVAVSARGVWPLRRVELCLGGGAGFYRTEARVSGSVLGIPGNVAQEDDLAGGLHGLAGIDLVMGRRWNLGIEARRLELRSDFGQLSGGSVEIGGTTATVVVRIFF